MTPQELADATGLHVETVRRLLRQGKLKTTTRGIAKSEAKRLASERDQRMQAIASRRAAAADAVAAIEGTCCTRLQAAGLMECSPRTIDRMVARGEIKRCKKRADRGLPSLIIASVRKAARASK